MQKSPNSELITLNYTIMNDTANKPWVEAPSPESDYHGHPTYSKIFLALIVLFGLSLVVGYFTSPMVAVVLIFITALIKAALVVGNFMHLKFEPKLVWVVLGVAVFIFLAFYFGVFPDITIVERDLVPKY